MIGRNTHTHTHNMHLTATVCREVAQVPASATSKWGLGRETGTASFVPRVNTSTECSEENLRELM